MVVYRDAKRLGIQLFRERLSEKVYATIPKGIVGGFEFSVFQRNLKELAGKAMEMCLRMLKESGGISLVFWATELDTSLSSSISQPSSICRYRARGLSLFRGDKVKTVIELDDLSSSVFQEKKKREKMEIKAIMTTWSTKSKTPYRSQFVTDKKHWWLVD